MITKQYTLAAFNSFYMHGHLLEALYHLYMYCEIRFVLVGTIFYMQCISWNIVPKIAVCKYCNNASNFII